MRKPVIGIAPDFNPGAGKGGSESEATLFIRNRYVTAVEAAGGIPVILPVITERAFSSAILDRLDGLVLTGSGPDIDPRRYGERKRFPFKVMSPERTDSEIALVTEARGRRFFIGVQWHPEYLYQRHRAHRALFEALVAAARGSRRAARRTA